jgi:hypothetical protein
MYMAKAIAAFVFMVATALVSAPGIIPVHGRWHLAFAIVIIVAGSVTTYSVRNRYDKATVVRTVR